MFKLQLKASLAHSMSGVFVLLVPLVSFPWFPPQLLSTVAPALMYPAAVLLLLVGLQTLSTERVDRLTMYVGLVIFASTAIGIAPLIWLDYSATGVSSALARYFRSIVTVGIAGLTFLTSYWAVMFLRQNARSFVRLLWAGSGIMFVVALLAIFTMFDVGPSRELYVGVREVTSLRPDAPIGNFQRITLLAIEPSFGGLELTAWWLAFLIAAGVVLRRTWIWLACLAAVLVAGLTQSLTAILGLLGLATGLFLLTVSRRSLHTILLYGAVAGVLAVVVVWVAGGETIQRPIDRLGQQIELVVTGDMWAEGPGDGSLAVRYGLANTAFNVWLAQPLFGSGLGLAGYSFKDFVPEWVRHNPRMGEYWAYVNNPEGAVFPSAKNLYLRLLSKVGLVGTSLFLALVLTCLVRGIRTAIKALQQYRINAESEAPYAVLSVAAVLGACAALFGYNSLDSFAVPYLWVWLGVLEGVRQLLRLENAS